MSPKTIGIIIVLLRVLFIVVFPFRYFFGIWLRAQGYDGPFESS